MKNKSRISIVREKLRESFEWFCPPDRIPSNKKLYYEAIRIVKALDKLERKEKGKEKRVTKKFIKKLKKGKI